MLKFYWLLCISLVAVFSAVAKDPASQSIDELEHGIENQHPATFYVLAGKLFETGKKQEAVFWFYVGQLRYRVYLTANKGNPSSDPALFASLSEEVGRPINEYAFGDIPQLAKMIDAVITWDRSDPNPLTPHDKYQSQYKENVADHPDCNLASALAFPNGSQATLQLGKLLLRGQINARSGVNAASVENIRCMWSGCQRANSACIAEKKTP
jgi:hypothetical protein